MGAKLTSAHGEQSEDHFDSKVELEEDDEHNLYVYDQILSCISENRMNDLCVWLRSLTNPSVIKDVHVPILLRTCIRTDDVPALKHLLRLFSVSTEGRAPRLAEDAAEDTRCKMLRTLCELIETHPLGDLVKEAVQVGSAAMLIYLLELGLCPFLRGQRCPFAYLPVGSPPKVGNPPGSLPLPPSFSVSASLPTPLSPTSPLSIDVSLISLAITATPAATTPGELLAPLLAHLCRHELAYAYNEAYSQSSGTSHSPLQLHPNQLPVHTQVQLSHIQLPLQLRSQVPLLSSAVLHSDVTIVRMLLSSRAVAAQAGLRDTIHHHPLDNPHHGLQSNTRDSLLGHPQHRVLACNQHGLNSSPCDRNRAEVSSSLCTPHLLPPLALDTQSPSLSRSYLPPALGPRAFALLLRRCCVTQLLQAYTVNSNRAQDTPHTLTSQHAPSTNTLTLPLLDLSVLSRVNIGSSTLSALATSTRSLYDTSIFPLHDRPTILAVDVLPHSIVSQRDLAPVVPTHALPSQRDSSVAMDPPTLPIQHDPTAPSPQCDSSVVTSALSSPRACLQASPWLCWALAPLLPRALLPHPRTGAKDPPCGHVVVPALHVAEPAPHVMAQVVHLSPSIRAPTAPIRNPTLLPRTSSDATHTEATAAGIHPMGEPGSAEGDKLDGVPGVQLNPDLASEEHVRVMMRVLWSIALCAAAVTADEAVVDALLSCIPGNLTVNKPGGFCGGRVLYATQVVVAMIAQLCAVASEEITLARISCSTSCRGGGGGGGGGGAIQSSTATSNTSFVRTSTATPSTATSPSNEGESDVATKARTEVLRRLSGVTSAFTHISSHSENRPKECGEELDLACIHGSTTPWPAFKTLFAILANVVMDTETVLGTALVLACMQGHVSVANILLSNLPHVRASRPPWLIPHARNTGGYSCANVSDCPSGDAGNHPDSGRESREDGLLNLSLWLSVINRHDSLCQTLLHARASPITTLNVAPARGAVPSPSLWVPFSNVKAKSAVASAFPPLSPAPQADHTTTTTTTTLTAATTPAIPTGTGINTRAIADSAAGLHPLVPSTPSAQTQMSVSLLHWVMLHADTHGRMLSMLLDAYVDGYLSSDDVDTIASEPVSTNIQHAHSFTPHDTAHTISRATPSPAPESSHIPTTFDSPAAHVDSLMHTPTHTLPCIQLLDIRGRVMACRQRADVPCLFTTHLEPRHRIVHLSNTPLSDTARNVDIGADVSLLTFALMHAPTAHTPITLPAHPILPAATDQTSLAPSVASAPSSAPGTASTSTTTRSITGPPIPTAAGTGTSTSPQSSNAPGEAGALTSVLTSFLRACTREITSRSRITATMSSPSLPSQPFGGIAALKYVFLARQDCDAFLVWLVTRQATTVLARVLSDCSITTSASTAATTPATDSVIVTASTRSSTSVFNTYTESSTSTSASANGRCSDSAAPNIQATYPAGSTLADNTAHALHNIAFPVPPSLFLCEWSSLLNKRTAAGHTVLYLALTAPGSHPLPVVELLLQWGADPNLCGDATRAFACRSTCSPLLDSSLFSKDNVNPRRERSEYSPSHLQRSSANGGELDSPCAIPSLKTTQGSPTHAEALSLTGIVNWAAPQASLLYLLCSHALPHPPPLRLVLLDALVRHGARLDTVFLPPGAVPTVAPRGDTCRCASDVSCACTPLLPEMVLPPADALFAAATAARDWPLVERLLQYSTSTANTANGRSTTSRETTSSDGTDAGHWYMYAPGDADRASPPPVGRLYIDGPALTLAYRVFGVRVLRALITHGYCIVPPSHTYACGDAWCTCVGATTTRSASTSTTMYQPWPVDAAGKDVLLAACENSDVEAVVLALNAGACVHRRDVYGKTALMYASTTQLPHSISILRALICSHKAWTGNGTASTLPTGNATTHTSARVHTNAIINTHMLGADPVARDTNGDSALSRACIRRLWPHVGVLLEGVRQRLQLSLRETHVAVEVRSSVDLATEEGCSNLYPTASVTAEPRWLCVALTQLTDAAIVAATAALEEDLDTATGTNSDEGDSGGTLHRHTVTDVLPSEMASEAVKSAMLALSSLSRTTALVLSLHATVSQDDDGNDNGSLLPSGNATGRDPLMPVSVHLRQVRAACVRRLLGGVFVCCAVAIHRASTGSITPSRAHSVVVELIQLICNITGVDSRTTMQWETLAAAQEAIPVFVHRSSSFCTCHGAHRLIPTLLQVAAAGDITSAFDGAMVWQSGLTPFFSVMSRNAAVRKLYQRTRLCDCHCSSESGVGDGRSCGAGSDGNDRSNDAAALVDMHLWEVLDLPALTRLLPHYKVDSSHLCKHGSERELSGSTRTSGPVFSSGVDEYIWNTLEDVHAQSRAVGITQESCVHVDATCTSLLRAIHDTILRHEE